MRERQCEVFGLEYSEAGLAYCRRRRLDVAKFDLELDSFTPNRTFDTAVSMEVAEHLPETVADRYVDLLSSLAPWIVFTAAAPGQGGTDHVNEQPASYWIDKFQARGFCFVEDRSHEWREEWEKSGDVADWYYKNLMILRRVGISGAAT